MILTVCQKQELNEWKVSMKTLLKFGAFIKEINKETGRLYKQSVLSKHKDDDDIKYYLNFIFNPYIVTGLADKKLEHFTAGYYDDTYSADFKTAKEALDYIKIHNTGRYEDVNKMLSFYIKCWLYDIAHPVTADYTINTCDIFKNLLKKDFSLGIDIKTINKIMPNLIPEFNVQLANKYFEDPDRITGKEFAITTKIDGSRIIAIKENGNVTFYTRQGQIYTGLVDLEEEMKLYMPDNICLDGEITLLNSGGLISKEQYKQTMKITRADGEKHGVKMSVFDYMSADEFRNQKCNVTYLVRRSNLNSIFNTVHTFKYFNLLPILYQGGDTSEIKKWLDHNIKHGEEGIMLNVITAPYDFHRTWNLQKVKKMKDLDLELVGFEEGTGRNIGKLGAILVEYKGNIVKVGSGFSDELRKEIWSHKDEWLGRTVTIQYFEETYNQKGGVSLRFPIYVDYRTDK